MIAANKSVQDLVSQVTGALSLVLASIAGISLLVGGIGIMNIMLVSVTERTQEIGLRKAVGATQQAILTQFLIEAIILSVAGGLVGTGIGVGSALIISILTPLQPTVPVGAILLAAGVSGSIGLIFGVAPARQAARLDPITALRSS
jgi:putative ABC transport system permease protein